MTVPVVRAAAPADAPALAALVGQLGYPATAEEIEQRLARIDGFASAVAFVAEVGGRVAGVATAHAFPSIHAEHTVVWLTALVVDERHRGDGIGRLLTNTVEVWARERGATRLSLTSGIQRADAHAFYQRLGFTQTGVRLAKTL